VCAVMAAQSYYQAEPAAIVVPRPLRRLGVVLAVLVVVLAALPIMMALDPAMTARTVTRQDPSLSGRDLEFAVTAAVGYAAVVHAVYAAVAVWFGVKAVKGRRWARIALTVLMVVATANSLDSALKGPEYLWWALGGDVIHLVVIGLLWLPRSVRGFFAAHRARV
jgi:hypothetical protein